MIFYKMRQFTIVPGIMPIILIISVSVSVVLPDVRASASYEDDDFEDKYQAHRQEMARLEEMLDRASHVNSRRINVKDFFYPKDASAASNKRATMRMEKELTSMEHSAQGITDGVKGIREKTRELEATLSEQEALLKKLDKGFGDMERILSTHKDVVDELLDTIGPNDSSFAISNQTCGEVLFARSGYITYSKKVLVESEREDSYAPLHCVWTVQAGHFSQIKLTIKDLRLPTNYKAYAVQLLSSGEGSSKTYQTIMSRELLPHMPLFLQGPVAFIVLTRNGTDLQARTNSSSDATTDMDTLHLYLEYEGRGKLEQKRTQFFHTTLPAHDGNGTFSDGDLESWRDRGLEEYYRNDDNLGYNFTREVGSVVLANFSTRVVFKLRLSRVWCPSDGFFMAIPNLLENGTSLINLCKSNVSAWDHGAIYGTPVAFLTGMNLNFLGQRLPFRVEWEAETPYSSNSFGSKCGGRLGGSGGTLSFRADNLTQTIRCVWVITPQPEVTTQLVIGNMTYHGGKTPLPQTYLTLVELIDREGNELAPPITQNLLSLVGASTWTNYSMSGREVYIIFKADAVAGSSNFSFEWALSGLPVTNGRDMTPGYALLDSDTGSLPSSLEGERPYQVFILSRPSHSSTMNFESALPVMELELSQVSPSVGNYDGKCLNETFAVYTSAGETLEREPLPCQLSENVTIEHGDGIVVIVVRPQNQTNSSDTGTSLNYRWKEDRGICGGVVKGTSGVINYKLGERYEANERCIWLLQTPHCSGMNLTLLLNGFDGDDDRHLAASTIGAGTARLSHDRFSLSSEQPSQTIATDFVILLFQTTGNSSGTGFSLEYRGLGCGNGTSPAGNTTRPPTNYHLQHFLSSNHNFSYDRAEPFSWRTREGLHVVAYSEPVSRYGLASVKSTVVDVDRLDFRQDMLHGGFCNYHLQEPVTFYFGDIHHRWGHGWRQWGLSVRQEQPKHPYGCPPYTLNRYGMNFSICTKYSSFLAIYRLFDTTVDWKFGFRWRKANSSC